MKYEAVATNGAAAMHLLMELSEKTKTFPFTVFQPGFSGDWSVTDRSCFEMTEKTQVKLVIMPVSVIQMSQNKKNDRKFLIYFGKMTEMFQRK